MYENAIYSIKGKAKLEVYVAGGGKWTRGWLKELLGSSVKLTNVKGSDGITRWQVSKQYEQEVIRGFLAAQKPVYLISDYTTTKKCTVSCQKARGSVCDCSCMGEFHKGMQLGVYSWSQVTDELLIGTDTVRVTRLFTPQSLPSETVK